MQHCKAITLCSFMRVPHTPHATLLREKSRRALLTVSSLHLCNEANERVDLHLTLSSLACTWPSQDCGPVNSLCSCWLMLVPDIYRSKEACWVQDAAQAALGHMGEVAAVVLFATTGEGKVSMVAAFSNAVRPFISVHWLHFCTCICGYVLCLSNRRHAQLSSGPITRATFGQSI